MSTNTVYLANPGLIDLDVIRVMGVSVKTGDSPIGYFGTGLKFALATLLRTGHEVVLRRGDERFVFEARPVIIRNQSFDRVYMNEEELPFTTELGRNWKVWQAYRELHSNMLDEGGRVSQKKLDDDTVFEVTGSAFHMEFVNRDSIFISGEPLCANSTIEVYDRPGCEIFYRGVRAGMLPTEGRFTYNILSQMELTEDRTLKSMWDVEYRIASAIPKLQHKGFIHELIEKGDKWDQKLNFGFCHGPSEEFVDVATNLYSNMSSNKSAKTVVEKNRQEKGEYHLPTLTDAEQTRLLEGFELMLKMGGSLSPEDVDVVETLGPGCFAIYHRSKNRVFVARSTLEWGLETVAATLFEEWLHMKHGYTDESRELQNFLFNKIAAMAAGKDIEPGAEKKLGKSTDSGMPF